MSEIGDFPIDEEIRHQANRDIAKRSLTGSFVYLFIWLSVVFFNNFYASAPKECLWVTLLFVFLSVSRIAMIKNFDWIYGKDPSLWKLLFFGLVLTTALAWGILCGIAIIHPVFQPVSFVLIVSTAGLAGGGGPSLAPNRWLTIGLISGLLIPGGLVALFSTNHPDLSVGVVFFVYWLGMFSITKTQHKEYWLALKSGYLIKKHSEKLEELNTMDGLTGLKNRAFFDQSLRLEMKKASRMKSPLSLLIIDIDYFKMVNDRYGHLSGDDCLRSLSTILSDTVQRETDIVARYGGEEFVIILPGIDKDHSIRIAEKIRKRVETIRIIISNETISFTISIGIVNTIPTRDITELVLIHAADKALYKAKSRGRNQVICNSI